MARRALAAPCWGSGGSCPSAGVPAALCPPHRALPSGSSWLAGPGCQPWQKFRVVSEHPGLCLPPPPSALSALAVHRTCGLVAVRAAAPQQRGWDTSVPCHRQCRRWGGIGAPVLPKGTAVPQGPPEGAARTEARQCPRHSQQPPNPDGCGCLPPCSPVPPTPLFPGCSHEVSEPPWPPDEDALCSSISLSRWLSSN